MNSSHGLRSNPTRTLLQFHFCRMFCTFGIRGSLGRFLQNFLSERSFKVRVGNQLSEKFLQINGVPQGGVLSVALFAVMINDIGAGLPQSVGQALFVDDFSIWCRASSTRVISRQLQLAATRLERWGLLNGFRFSSSKTTAVHFCRRRSCPDLIVRMYVRGAYPSRTMCQVFGDIYGQPPEVQTSL